MKQPRINIKWYILTDIFICIITWLCFYYLRTVIYDFPFSIPPGFYIGLFLYTLGWISLHFLAGSYNDLYHKSRLAEAGRSVVIVLIGCLFLLFFFILKNPQSNNYNYYFEFYSLLFPNLVLTILSRIIFLGIVKKQLVNKKVFFNVLVIGSGKTAREFLYTFQNTKDQGGSALKHFTVSTGKWKLMYLIVSIPLNH